jgi:hypothetical protein
MSHTFFPKPGLLFAQAKLGLFAGLLVVLYNDWIFAPLLNPHISTSRALISEISARTQVYHSAFQTMDIFTGVLTLAVLAKVWRFVEHGQAW